MLRNFHAVGTVSLAICLLTTLAWGEIFECAFIQEKYPSGKPNQASCSMLPENVYSTSGYTPQKWEHCKVDRVHSYEDLIDVKVDTNEKRVQWNKHFGLAEHAKASQKAFYMKKCSTERDAEEKVNFEGMNHESFTISAYHKSKMRIYCDDIATKAFDPPKEVPQHNLILVNNTYLFYLYIPEVLGHAILLPTHRNGRFFVGSHSFREVQIVRVTHRPDCPNYTRYRAKKPQDVQ